MDKCNEASGCFAFEGLGGNGAVVAPINASGTIGEALIPFIRSFDPDHIAIHLPTLADLAHENPELIDKWTQARVSQGENREEVWQALQVRPVDISGLESLAEQITSNCSPFKGFMPETHKFPSSEIIRWNRYDDLRYHLTTLTESVTSRTFALDLSNIDPDIALMIESRIGAVDPADREGRNVIELPVLEEDLSEIIRLAITGNVQPRTWDISARYRDSTTRSGSRSDADISIDAFLADCPFSHSGQFTSKIRTAFPEPPTVCVIGETAEDYALAGLCDRLFKHAAWIPTRLLKEDSPQRLAVKVALYSLRNVPETPDRPVLFTSISESETSVDEFAASVNDMFGLVTADGEPILDPRRSVAITPELLATERGRCMLADPDAFALRRRSPVSNDAGDRTLLAPVEVPLPRALEHIGPSLDWCIDVWMSDHQIPPRTAITKEVLQLPPPEFGDAVIRSSRNGLTFESANFGFVMAGLPYEDHLASPILRFPSGDAIFAELAASSKARIEQSPAGRRSAIAAEMWGSFASVATDLAGPVRELLNAFLPPKGTNGNYDMGYEIRGEGYVAIEDAATVLAVQPQEARTIIDRLLTLNVLRRGFLLYCARCRAYDFYRTDQVGITFECHACGHASPLTRGQWYGRILSRIGTTL